MPSDAAPIEPDDLLRRTFTSVRRGFDPVEVQKYLMVLASELRAGRERERDLEGRLREAEKRADELAEMAPSRLSSLVGEETARVLDAANAAATEIRTRAEENVARLLREAQDEATALRREAETVLERRSAEAEEAAAAIQRQADEVLQQARVDAEGEVEAGRQRGREMVVEAQRVRERMLRDLARRRKLLRQQIEQLQAGRGRLVAAYDVVRETLDTATEELRVAVPEAKLAAEAAALRAAEDEAGEATFEEELAALSAAADEVAVDGELAADAAAADGDLASDVAAADGVATDVAPEAGEPARGTGPDADGPADLDGGGDLDDADARGAGAAGPHHATGDGRGADEPERAEVPEGTGSAADVEGTASGEGADGAATGGRSDGPTEAEGGAGTATGGSSDGPTEAEGGAGTERPEGAPTEAEGEGSSPSAKVAGLFARMKEESGLGDGDVAVDVVAAADEAAEAVDEALDGTDDHADAADAHHADVEDPDARARARRDDAVEPLVRQIGRMVKRELSDEQNELLDGVRRQDTDLQVEDLLPTPEAHVERFSAAVHAGLVAAAEAGATSVGGGDATPPSALRELGAEFAAELVAPLRERIGRAFAEAGDDPDELAERLRACYREWRTQRVDGFADHTVVAAYNRGVLDAVGAGTALRWLVDDGESPSPDCEDNALAGPTVTGEAFPTGHLAPPAHPSCRCLLVVATATTAPRSTPTPAAG